MKAASAREGDLMAHLWLSGARDDGGAHAAATTIHARLKTAQTEVSFQGKPARILYVRRRARHRGLDPPASSSSPTWMSLFD